MTAEAMKDVVGRTWPDGDLENVGACPLCGEGERALLQDKLVDNVFFSAPGEWVIWRCNGCRSAYYDPRPSPETINIAYRHYYTHDAFVAALPTSFSRRLRASLANGYRNMRFGTRFEPFSRWGYVIGRLIPPVAWPLETEYRYLPTPPHSEAKLLDVGCGGGDWLARAHQANWKIFGADPDPAARRRGAERGIPIREGGAEAWLDEAGTFDVVTSSHSLEHVHEPNKMLGDMLDLLRPGGTLIVETPNIDGWGYRLYGRNRIGLDPPRHLVIFNRNSLVDALDRAGFVDIRQRRRAPYFPALALYSARLAEGYRFDDPSAPVVRTPNWLTKLRANFAWRRAEALLFTAKKPD